MLLQYIITTILSYYYCQFSSMLSLNITFIIGGICRKYTHTGFGATNGLEHLIYRQRKGPHNLAFGRQIFLTFLSLLQWTSTKTVLMDMAQPSSQEIWHYPYQYFSKLKHYIVFILLLLNLRKVGDLETLHNQIIK